MTTIGIKSTLSGIIIAAIAWILARPFVAAIAGFERMNDVQPWHIAGVLIMLWIAAFTISAGWASGKPDPEIERLKIAAKATAKAAPKGGARMTAWRDHHGGG